MVKWPGWYLWLAKAFKKSGRFFADSINIVNLQFCTINFKVFILLLSYVLIMTKFSVYRRLLILIHKNLKGKDTAHNLRIQRHEF